MSEHNRQATSIGWEWLDEMDFLSRLLLPLCVGSLASFPEPI